MSTIRAVTFDLDDTLWDVWAAVERAEAELHAWLDERYPHIPARYTPLEIRALCTQIAKDNPAIAHDRSACRKLGLVRAAEAVGYPAPGFDVEAAFEVFYAGRNAVEFFPDALPALERLHGRYRLAALSNGNADLGRIGIAHLFDFALSAIQIGRPKPERAMYDEALKRLGIAPHQILHIGDDPDHDVRAPAEFGWRTVWVNRSDKPWPGGPHPDATVTTLAELDTVLARLA